MDRFWPAASHRIADESVQRGTAQALNEKPRLFPVGARGRWSTLEKRRNEQPSS